MSNLPDVLQDACSRLDDRTIEQRLNYLLEYASQIPFAGDTQRSWAQVLFPGAAADIPTLAALYRSPELADGKLAPQQAFLLALLRQLDTPRHLFNSLSSTHRQFYYRDFLGFKERTIKPDQVLLSFRLKESAAEVLLPMGTLFNAGQDNQGRLVQYQLDRPLQANQGQLTDIRWCHSAGETGQYSCVLQDATQGQNWSPQGNRLFSGNLNQERPVITGRVIASDALAMSEGRRSISVSFSSTPDAGQIHAEVSTTKGWLSLVADEGPGYNFSLGKDAPAITSANGLDGFATDAPLLKLSRLDGLPVPLVSRIKVTVEHATQVRFGTSTGSASIDKPSMPFGQVPQVGVNFISLMAADWCRKQVPVTVVLTPEWLGLPGIAFNQWYAPPYTGAPQNNQSFTVQTKIYSENGWEHLGEPLPLFGNADSGAPVGISLTLPSFVELPAQPNDSGDPEDWSSRIRLELAGHDFLHHQHAVSPASNPPYTPQWKSLSVEYSAVDTAPDEQYLLTPFGYLDQISAVGRSDLPQLYLGFSGLQPGQQLSLYWKLQSPQMLTLNFEYLDIDNRWSSLNETVIDGTRGLFDSGLWTASLPANAASQAQWMPAGRHWIRILVTPPEDSTVPDASNYPWLQAVQVNCMSATLVNGENLDAAHFDQPLEAGTITQVAQTIDGLSSVIQPWPSYGGRAPDSPSVFNQRAAWQLSHRGRGHSWKDMRALLLDQFPEIHEVYTPSQAGFSDPRLPGLQTITVIPAHGQMDNTDRLRPVFNAARLDSMRRYLLDRTSPWVNITVSNPSYVNVDVHYEIEFSLGISPEYGYAQLREIVLQRYAPWAWDSQSEAKPGSRLDYYELLAFIQQQNFVERVVALTLNDAMLSIEGDSAEVLIPQL